MTRVIWKHTLSLFQFLYYSLIIISRGGNHGSKLERTPANHRLASFHARFNGMSWFGLVKRRGPETHAVLSVNSGHTPFGDVMTLPSMYVPCSI